VTSPLHRGYTAKKKKGPEIMWAAPKKKKDGKRLVCPQGKEEGRLDSARGRERGTKRLAIDGKNIKKKGKAQHGPANWL